MKVLCVIPARYGSTRLPGKPLALIQGKPVIQRVRSVLLWPAFPTRSWWPPTISASPMW